MEGINNIENLADWRDKKNNAPVEALALKEQIDNYDQLTPAEKISELTAINKRLAEDNANRYIHKVLSHEIDVLTEEDRHSIRMSELEKAA